MADNDLLHIGGRQLPLSLDERDQKRAEFIQRIHEFATTEGWAGVMDAVTQAIQESEQ